MKTIVKTLVVDDTITYRNILKVALSKIDGVEVVGTASNGAIALERIEQLKPDLVTLDVEMPVMGGLEALDQIKKKFPEVCVIMVSSANRSSAETTIRALGHGALDFISKPDGSNIDDSIEKIRFSLRLMIDAFHVQRGRSVVKPVVVEQLTRQPARPAIRGFDLLAIGSSTGGPTALSEILPKLRADMSAPIVIVQHMPAGFTSTFAQSLDKNSSISVCEASVGEALKPGCAYVAPGGKHMTFRRERDGAIISYLVETNDNTPVNNCKPSIDVTFKSLAECYQGKVLSVILTGMGVDGAEGVRSFKESGTSFCITQNEASCVVYGMPRAVDREGLSDSSLHLTKIAEEINNLIGARNYVPSRN